MLGLGEASDAEVELLEAYRLSRELNTPADEIDVVLRLAEVALARNDRAMVQNRIGELERMGLARLRPDLEPEFDRLKARLEESVPVRAP